MSMESQLLAGFITRKEITDALGMYVCVYLDIALTGISTYSRIGLVCCKKLITLMYPLHYYLKAVNDIGYFLMDS